MEREDPIERLERQQAENKANGPLKKVIVAMSVIAAVLAVALVAVLISKNRLVGDLNQEKTELTEQVRALQSDYENLSSEYDNINSQLDSSREEIAQLMERVKKADATNRKKIRQYERELGTLRTIMRSYITQIDSLNQLNHKLTIEAAKAKKEARAQKKQNEELNAQVEQLSGIVATGSIVKGRGLAVTAFTDKDKITDKSNRVSYLITSVNLLENDLAPKGPMRIYIRVTAPDGTLLLDGSNATFEFGGETLQATASREVDYEGKDIELSIYVNHIASYSKGSYKVQAYSLQSQLGTTELYLR